MSTNDKITIFQAPYILQGKGLTPVSSGALKVKNGKIAAVSGFRTLPKTGKEKLISLQDCLIMPGFINSHTHLELSCLRGLIKNKKPFSKWVMEIIEAKKNYCKKIMKPQLKPGYSSL